MTSLHFYHAPDDSMATKNRTISPRGFTNLQPPKVMAPSLDNYYSSPKMVNTCLDTNSSWKIYVIKYTPPVISLRAGTATAFLFLPISGTKSSCCVRWAPSHQAPWFLSFPLLRHCQLGLPGFPQELLCLLAPSAQPSLLAHMLPSQLLLLKTSWRVCAGFV